MFTSVSIFINNVLNSLSSISFISVSLFNFQRFSLFLSTENSSCAFPFCLTFSVSVNLGEIVAYLVSEGVFLRGSVSV